MEHGSRGRLGTAFGLALDVLTTLALVVACVAIVVVARRPAIGQPGGTAASGSGAKPARPPAPPLPTEPISLEGAVVKGSTNAAVGVVEYSDFQCPFCGKFARETLPALDQKYIQTGKVLMAFRHLPLEAIHPFALNAATIAECAAGSGKFWEMHDQLFRNSKRLDDAGLRFMAQSLGITRPSIDACLSGSARSRVRDDATTARALAVSGTPTFFIGRVIGANHLKLTQRLAGAVGLSQFEAAFEAASKTH
jgi:protein-disulfide isomerase